MKIQCGICWVVAAVLAGAAVPDDDDDDGPLPQTPTAFETRNTGETGEADTAEIRKKKKRKTVTVSFTALTDSRVWRDTKGTAIKGRLLAFEKDGAGSSTVIRDGKVRMLADGGKKFSLLPVAKLSEEDQVFIKNLAAVRKQGAPRTK